MPESVDAVRRAALPQPLQLPRRCQLSDRPGRRGSATRSQCAGHHRPRQLRRRTALRRGQHRLWPPQHLRCRAQPRTQRATERHARSGRRTPAGPRQGSGGLPPAGLGDDRGAPDGRREGQAVVRPRRAHRHRPRPLGDPHRLPQGDAVAGGDRRSRRPLRPRPRRRRAEWKPRHTRRRRDHDRLVGMARDGTCRSSPPATSTTRPRTSVGSRPRWPRSVPGAASPTSTAGWTSPGRHTCEVGRRWSSSSVATQVRSAAPSTLAGELAFDLHKASPRLPKQGIPEGETPGSWLRILTERGFQERYAGTPHERDARARVDAELEVILRKDFAGYFVIVHDIVSVRPRSGDPVPGERVGSQLCRLLRPRASPRSTRSTTGCRSSGSSPSTARRSPTSTSTSTPTGGRRSSSGSTRPTAAATPPRSATW